MEGIEESVFLAFEGVAAEAAKLPKEQDVAACFFEAFVASFLGAQRVWNSDQHVGLPLYDFTFRLPDGRSFSLKVLPVGNCLVVSGFFESHPDKVFSVQIPLTDFGSSKKEIEAHSIDSDLWLKTASEVWSKILDPLTPVKMRPVDPPKAVSEPSPLLISGPHLPPEADPLRADRPPRAPVSFDPFGVGHGDLHGDLPQPFGNRDRDPFGVGGRRDPGFGGHVGPDHPMFGNPRDPYYRPHPGPDPRGLPPSRRPPPGARFDPFGPPGLGPSDPDPDHEPFRPDFMYM